MLSKPISKTKFLLFAVLNRFSSLAIEDEDKLQYLIGAVGDQSFAKTMVIIM